MSNNFNFETEGVVHSKDGKILQLSVEQFEKRVIEGKCCFICCDYPTDKEFNDEHVIPDWLLSYCGLHDQQITLPNQVGFSYSRYKIPCCKKCNGDLSRIIEDPMSKLLKMSYEDFVTELKNNGTWKLYHWICLIFLKTHLRDRDFRYHVDRRKENYSISENYDWSLLHHIHCVVRSHFTCAEIQTNAVGSIFIMPAKTNPSIEVFDYADIYEARTVFLKVHDIAIFVVLDDACGCFSLQPDFMNKWVKGKLFPIQLRELTARLAYLNTLIKIRPVFSTDFSSLPQRIIVETPDHIEVNPGNGEDLGGFFSFLCESYIEEFKIRNMCAEDIRNNINRGAISFIVDSNREFLKLKFINEQEAD